MARSVSHESSWNASSANQASRIGVQPVLKTSIPEKIDDEKNASSSMNAQRATRDPWLPDLEQKKYYSDEFIKLSQNPCGWIAGDRAREFFFKSKLPTVELRYSRFRFINLESFLVTFGSWQISTETED
jgi:RalBP1-associated Eps domain-containing protein